MVKVNVTMARTRVFPAMRTSKVYTTQLPSSSLYQTDFKRYFSYDISHTIFLST